MTRLLATALLLCLCASTEAAPPSRIHAHYEVYKGSFRVAVMDETFVRDGDRYSLESISNAVGLLKMFKDETIRVTSSGTLTAHGLRPERYASLRKLDGDRDTRASFNWARMTIVLADRYGARSQPLPKGTQDRLSAMYQLMFLPLQDMRVLKFYMTNGSKVDDYTFNIKPDASVSVPLGTFKALYLATPPQDNSNRTEIWVDAERHFPYKLVITEPDGGTFVQVLTQVEFIP